MTTSAYARRILPCILKQRLQQQMETHQGNLEVDDPDIYPIILYIDQELDLDMER